MQCFELLNGRRFPLRLKMAVYEIDVRPAILYGCMKWCLKESEMGICDGQRDPWFEQCVEYSSKTEKGLQI